MRHGKILNFQEGKVTLRGQYERGKKQGVWIYYSPKTSKIVKKERYNNNYAHGLTEVWDEKTGHLTEKILYNFGGKVYRETYNNDGSFVVTPI